MTGANGFLGTNVVLALLERGHEVRAMLRPSSGAPPASWGSRAEIVRADLRAAIDAPTLLAGVDVVLHLAAVMRGTPDAQFAGTVVATERLLEGMRNAGRPRRLVLASSFSVYDWTAARGLIDEDSPLENRPFERDAYAIAKIWQERQAARWASENGGALAILRPAFIYGPGGPIVAGAGIQVGRAFLVVGPSSRLLLTHVHNCAQAFANAAESGVAGTFNIVDDERVSAWRYAASLHEPHSAGFRIPVPYVAGLGLAYLATAVSRVLFPPAGGKLPGVLIPRRYRARFRPLRSHSGRAKAKLGWTGAPVFARRS